MDALSPEKFFELGNTAAAHSAELARRAEREREAVRRDRKGR